eukprot:8288319-Pyramimonas_sp.AAC.1
MLRIFSPPGEGRGEITFTFSRASPCEYCEPQNIPLSWSNHDASRGIFRSVGRITMRATEHSA